MEIWNSYLRTVWLVRNDIKRYKLELEETQMEKKKKKKNLEKHKMR